MPETAIIIPHYNDVARLLRCLDALMPQVTEDTEVVVADNGSTQDLAPVRERWPDLSIVHQPEKGAGPARNAGVAATTAPWIFFIDADCIPDADWVATGLKVRSEGTIVGGPVALFDETPPPRTGAEAFETEFAFQMDWYLEDKRFLPSCQLVLSRALFDDVGPFLGDISEDVEWAHRALDKGYRLELCQSLRISHPTRSDWDALCRKWRRITNEGYEENRHSTKGVAFWVVKALLMMPSAAAHTPRVLMSGKLRGGDKFRALGTLYRLRWRRMTWMLLQVLRGKRIGT